MKFLIADLFKQNTMKKNIYSSSEVRIVNGKKIFIKNYDKNVAPDKVKDEYLKNVCIYKLAENSKLFKFPKPIKQEGRTIEFEAINNFIELREFLYKNNNIFHKNHEKINGVMSKLGACLGEIHNNLELNKKEELYDKINKGEKRYLYGDFGLSNILISNKEIVLIDPSFNNINNKVSLHGTIYFDLAYFYFNLRFLYPLKYYPLFCFKYVPGFFDVFIKPYIKKTKNDINLNILNKYFLEITKRYLRHLDTRKLKNKIWKKIIENGRNRDY